MLKYLTSSENHMEICYVSRICCPPCSPAWAAAVWLCSPCLHSHSEHWSRSFFRAWQCANSCSLSLYSLCVCTVPCCRISCFLFSWQPHAVMSACVAVLWQQTALRSSLVRFLVFYLTEILSKAFAGNFCMLSNGHHLSDLLRTCF